jgi:tetratricopeptide (TPR) repeat protein
MGSVRNLLVAALLLGALPSLADKEKARERFERGTAEYVLDHYDAAIREFEEGFKEYPDPRFLYNIAQAHERAGRPAPAAEFYSKYLDFMPESPDHVEVEKKILELQRAAKSSPPEAPASPTVKAAAPAPGPSAPAVSAAIAAPVAASAAPVEKRKRRWPLWVGIGAGAVALAGVITIALVATTPDDAAIPATTAGNIMAGFPP